VSGPKLTVSSIYEFLKHLTVTDLISTKLSDNGGIQMAQRYLTVRRTTYGVSEHDVIMLHYDDGSEVPTAYIENGMIPLWILERIKWASEHEFKITYDWEGRS
jgi:hypothetical protein